MYYLEQLLGGPSVFEGYLKAHVQQFAHKSITTTDFKAFLIDYFTRLGPEYLKKLESVNWDGWFHQPGMVKIKHNEIAFSG